jgi:hypothetical protein
VSRSTSLWQRATILQRFCVLEVLRVAENGADGWCCPSDLFSVSEAFYC